MTNQTKESPPKTVRLPKLPLHADVVFRRIFDQPHLLCSLLNAILALEEGHRITELTLLPTQVHGPLAGDKEVVLDLRASCQDGRQFHVELQVRPYHFYTARSLFYWSGMYHGQLKAGQVYGELRPVISIHILYYALLADEDDLAHPHNIFEVRNRRGGKLLTDHLQIHTIEMGKFFKPFPALSTNEDFWVYFLKHGHKMTDDEIRRFPLPEIIEAEEKLQVISQDQQLRMMQLQREDAERDKIAYEKDVHLYWRNESKRLALEEGKRLADESKRLVIDEGKRLGIDEGKRLGIDEGKREEARAALLDFCEAFGIEIPPGSRDTLLTMDLTELRALRSTIKSTRAWPSVPAK